MLRFILALIFLSGLIIFSSNILAQEVEEESSVTEAPQATPEEVATEEETGEGVVTGTVTAINKEANTIALKDKDGNQRSFSVVEGETILWKGVADITLADIAVGNEAEIGYYTDDKGTLVASWVDLILPEEEAPAVPEAPVAPSPKATPEE